jgi:homoserine kinase
VVDLVLHPLEEAGKVGMILDSFQVLVPASTSNLGSGFDTLSAALSVYLKVHVEVCQRENGQSIEGWEHAPEENVLMQSLLAAMEALGRPCPGVRISMENPIPLRRGLGSSGAAIIAGIKIAEEISGQRLSPEQVFEIAYPLEGHPDNLTASLLGGWVLSRLDEGGRVRAERIASTLEVRFVLAIPEKSVATRDARAILPEKYCRADAVFNLQRCALFVHALHAGRKDLLREATRDRLHQSYRAGLVPGLPELLDLRDLEVDLANSLLALWISGSGSAVVALADDKYEQIGDWMCRTFASRGTPAACVVLDLDRSGARVIRPAT